MEWLLHVTVSIVFVIALVLVILGILSIVPNRSLQAIRMNENTVQIMYTPSKAVYVTCYSDDVLLECVNASDYGRIIYTTQHIATEYTVKTYYQDGSIEENRITVQVP